VEKDLSRANQERIGDSASVPSLVHEIFSRFQYFVENGYFKSLSGFEMSWSTRQIDLKQSLRAFL